MGEPLPREPDHEPARRGHGRHHVVDAGPGEARALQRVGVAANRRAQLEPPGQRLHATERPVLRTRVPGRERQVGERVAARALENSLRERTVDLARTIADELALSPHADTDRAARQLGAILTRRRGLRSAQLVMRHGKELKSIHVTFGEDGAVLDTGVDPSASIPTTTEVALADADPGHSWRVELPLKDSSGRSYGALRLEASLSQAEEIATSERSVFFLVAGIGAALLTGLFSLILGHWLTRPLSQLAGAMEAVASGAIDETAMPGTPFAADSSAAPTVPEMVTPLPTFSPKLIPETVRSGLVGRISNMACMTAWAGEAPTAYTVQFLPLTVICCGETTPSVLVGRLRPAPVNCSRGATTCT